MAAMTEVLSRYSELYQRASLQVSQEVDECISQMQAFVAKGRDLEVKMRGVDQLNADVQEVRAALEVLEKQLQQQVGGLQHQLAGNPSNGASVTGSLSSPTPGHVSGGMFTMARE
jgi:predicted RNase H-like nuclease (RuvC/YqgF family)